MLLEINQFNSSSCLLVSPAAFISHLKNSKLVGMPSKFTTTIKLISAPIERSVK